MSAKMLLKSSLQYKYVHANEFDLAPPAIPCHKKCLQLKDHGQILHCTHFIVLEVCHFSTMLQHLRQWKIHIKNAN